MSKQEFLTLHFKRSKLFMLSGEGQGTKRFQAGPTHGGAIQVPVWVEETQTYQMGIKDGSIVNLTPPKPTIIYRDAPTKAEAEVSTDVEEDDSAAEDNVEDPKDEDGADSEDESPTDEAPKPRSRKKKKTSGPAGLIETTIKAQ